jgi:hypothetical protein
MEQSEPAETKKKFSFFGFTTKDIIGLVMIIIGFLLILIGIFMIAFGLLNRTPTAQQPPPQHKKTKKAIKKRPEEAPTTPIDINKKENEIKQNASNILLEEYNNTKIPSTIIQESDTESERELETKDDDLLN